MLVLPAQEVVTEDAQVQPLLHAPFLREQFPVWEPLQLTPQLPDTEELPLLWQERVEEVARPLVERLEAQRPRVAPLQALEKPPRVQPPRDRVVELPEEPPPPLREQVELPQARAPVQRVGDRLLADPLVPPPPPRQRPIQQAEVPLAELVDPRLQKFAPPF